ncbi:MAG: hypothetical protein WDN00_17340 [Limisphaerales bacterium]
MVGAGWSAADFYFDYSTAGIPVAPHSTGGSTRGLKMVVNLGVGSGGTFPAGISVSPLGFGISDNFEMRFDLWLNYNKSGMVRPNAGVPAMVRLVPWHRWRATLGQRDHWCYH